MSLLDLGGRVPSSHDALAGTPATTAFSAPRAGRLKPVCESALVIGLFVILGGIGLYLRARLALPL